MQISSLQEQKKELKELSPGELIEICLRLGRYKKENKELLNYILFHQHDPAAYTEAIKTALAPDFELLNKQSYYCTKSLRKILRVISRQAKYIADTRFEIELLIWFCFNYLQYVDLKSNNKSLQNIFIRQTEKINKLNSKVHEDLAFDYQQELDKIYKLAEQNTTWFNL